jgi:hypothetical protein
MNRSCQPRGAAVAAAPADGSTWGNCDETQIFHPDCGTPHTWTEFRHVLQREPGPHQSHANLSLLGTTRRHRLYADETRRNVRNYAGVISGLLRSAGAPAAGLAIVTEPILGLQETQPWVLLSSSSI